MSIHKYYGHYQVIAELGRGGMAVVYKCWEESLGRFVAIKVLSEHLINDKELKERFLREAKSMASINHPNVIQVHFIGEEKGLPYFAMEYIDGKSLSGILSPNKQLSIEHAKNILYQACEGLLAAHHKNLIHRDIKPGNLMISDDGLLKLVDFGIAQSHDFKKRLTSTGDLVGTPGYLSPEACVGENIDFRADIYSLGIVFYEMLAGKVPFENDSPLGLLQEVSDSNILDIRTINKKVDEQTAGLLEKMVARLPEERFQNCQEILDVLERPVNNHSIESIIKTQTLSDYKKTESKLNNKITLINKQVVANTSHKNKVFTPKKILLLGVLLAVILGFIISNGLNEHENTTFQMEFVSNEPNTPDVSISDWYQENLAEYEPQELEDQEAIENPLENTTENSLQVENTSQGYQCIEIGEFLWAGKKSTSSSHTRKSKSLLKKLQLLTINEVSKGNILHVYSAKQNTCPHNNQSLALKAEVKQNKLSRLLSSSGIEKGKVYITLTLVNKKSKKRLAQKRFTIRDLGEEIEKNTLDQESDLTKKFFNFIISAIRIY